MGELSATAYFEHLYNLFFVHHKELRSTTSGRLVRKTDLFKQVEPVAET